MLPRIDEDKRSGDDSRGTEVPADGANFFNKSSRDDYGFWSAIVLGVPMYLVELFFGGWRRRRAAKRSGTEAHHH